MHKLKRDDEVVVIVGRDKGKRGRISRVLKNDRFIVSGINMIKRHTKPNPNIGRQGGIVEKEAPIHASNVAIYNAATSKADRVGFKILEDGTKVRIFKSDNSVIG
jgi:large subunit ribosomal protein L24